jgi:hypothetical protein
VRRQRHPLSSEVGAIARAAIPSRLGQVDLRHPGRVVGGRASSFHPATPSLLPARARPSRSGSCRARSVVHTPCHGASGTAGDPSYSPRCSCSEVARSVSGSAPLRGDSSNAGSTPPFRPWRRVTGNGCAHEPHDQPRDERIARLSDSVALTNGIVPTLLLLFAGVVALLSLRALVRRPMWAPPWSGRLETVAGDGCR